MNIIDRISLHRLLTTILNFIISALKIIVPKNNKETTVPEKRRRLRPKK